MIKIGKGLFKIKLPIKQSSKVNHLGKQDKHIKILIKKNYRRVINISVVVTIKLAIEKLKELNSIIMGGHYIIMALSKV